MCSLVALLLRAARLKARWFVWGKDEMIFESERPSRDEFTGSYLTDCVCERSIERSQEIFWYLARLIGRELG